MVFARRSFPSNAYSLFCMILFFIAISITFYDAEFRQHIIKKISNNSLRNAILTNLFSKDYIRVQLNLKSYKAHCQVHDNLIVYILSTVTNFRRRSTIRSTWGSPLRHTCFLFIVGKPKNSSSVQLKLENEKQQHSDIVQIDHFESYANVIYKELAALYWSYRFYPFIPYLFKTDDDLIVDTRLLSSIIDILVTNRVNDTSYIPVHRPKLFRELAVSDRATFFRGAWSMSIQPTLRDGKFGISTDIWPHPLLPLYCSGFGWIMSKQVRNKLVEASYTYPIKKTPWIGDVFLSGFLAKEANVECMPISIDYAQTASGNCSCLMLANPMLTVCSSSFHGGVRRDNQLEVFQEYEKAWNVIQIRHKILKKTYANNQTC